MVNGAGETEKWLAVAASDGGRIVAARNVPGRNSRFSWFKVWEPNGTSTVEGPLNAPSGWAIVLYPLGFDVTADGKHMVYGYSNSGFCCPINYSQGTYVRPVTNSSLDPIQRRHGAPDTVRQPDDRALGRDGVRAGRAGHALRERLHAVVDDSGTGLEVRRTDVAANGQLAATELEQWDGGSQTVGKIAVVATQGVDQSPTFPAAVDCFVPTTGVATDVSLSMDATRIAWTDDQGLKVAGAPTTAADRANSPRRRS